MLLRSEELWNSDEQLSSYAFDCEKYESLEALEVRSKSGERSYGAEVVKGFVDLGLFTHIYSLPRTRVIRGPLVG